MPIPRRPLTSVCLWRRSEVSVFRGCERCDVHGGWEALITSATQYNAEDWLGGLFTRRRRGTMTWHVLRSFPIFTMAGGL